MGNEFNKNKTLPTKALEQTIFIGDVKDPVCTMKRNEINNYFTDELFKMYELWEMWSMGFGLPGGKSWTELPMFIIDIIKTFEHQHRKMKRS